MLMITIISMPYFNNVQKKLDKISLIVRENLNGIRVIRAFASQDKEINKFKTETRQQKDIQVKVGRIQALLNPFTYLIVNVAIVLIVYFGGTEVNVGGLSQGEVIALVNYMNSILLALIVFANVLSTYNKAGASYTRIFEVLGTEPAVVNDGQIQIYRESEDCIEFRHVSFAYEQKNVLNDLNFTIKRGQTIGIIGGTGAGKTSLVNLIGRFYDVSSGEILINGEAIKNYGLHALRSFIGFVPQYAALISGTIRENLQLGNQTANDQQLLKALEIAQERKCSKIKRLD
ncbi:MAG: ABC transporter ATP-binding protein [Thomasclavelia ramosa]